MSRMASSAGHGPRHTAHRVGRSFGKLLAQTTLTLAPLLLPSGCGSSEPASKPKTNEAGANNAAGARDDESRGGATGNVHAAGGLPITAGSAASSGTDALVSAGQGGRERVAEGGAAGKPSGAEGGTAGSPNAGPAGFVSTAGMNGAAGCASESAEPVRIIDAPFNRNLSGFDVQGPDPVFVDGVGGCEWAMSLIALDVAGTPWNNYQMTKTLDESFKSGDVLYLQFWARSPDDITLELSWEYNLPPWDQQYYANLLATTKGWSLYRLVIVLSTDITAESSIFRLRYGSSLGVLELACLTLDSYGPNADLEQLPEVVP